MIILICGEIFELYFLLVSKRKVIANLSLILGKYRENLKKIEKSIEYFSLSMDILKQFSPEQLRVLSEAQISAILRGGDKEAEDIAKLKHYIKTVKKDLTFPGDEQSQRQAYNEVGRILLENHAKKFYVIPTRYDVEYRIFKVYGIELLTEKEMLAILPTGITVDKICGIGLDDSIIAKFDPSPIHELLGKNDNVFFIHPLCKLFAEYFMT